MSWAGEASDYRNWYPNSFRFETEKEAAAFVKQLQEQWIPKNFIFTTRVVKSKDPVNARWDGQDAVRLNVAFEPAPVMPAAVMDDEDGEESIAPIINERVYRGNARKRKVLRRIFNRETYRRFKDETRWYDEESKVLLSEALREDLRHMLSHQDCRLELTRRLYEGFKAAHGGRAPGETYVIRDQDEHGSCRFDTDEQVRQIKEDYGDDEGPHYEVSERLVTKSAKKRAVKLQNLKARLAKPESAKDEFETALAYLSLLAPTKQPTYQSYYLKDCAGAWGKRHGHSPHVSHDALIEAAVRLGLTFKPTSDDVDIGVSVCDVQMLLEERFDLGDAVGSSSAMQDFVRWLAVPEVHATYRKALAEFRAEEGAGAADLELAETRRTAAVARAKAKLAWVRELTRKAAGG